MRNGGAAILVASDYPRWPAAVGRVLEERTPFKARTLFTLEDDALARCIERHFPPDRRDEAPAVVQLHGETAAAGAAVRLARILRNDFAWMGPIVFVFDSKAVADQFRRTGIFDNGSTPRFGDFPLGFPVLHDPRNVEELIRRLATSEPIGRYGWLELYQRSEAYRLLAEVKQLKAEASQTRSPGGDFTARVRRLVVRTLGQSWGVVGSHHVPVTQALNELRGFSDDSPPAAQLDALARLEQAMRRVHV